MVKDRDRETKDILSVYKEPKETKKSGRYRNAWNKSGDIYVFCSYTT